MNISTNNYIICVNLNGKTLTTGGIALPSNHGSYISVMDSAATDGTLIGKASSNGSAINMTNKNGVVDIYGGTLKSSGAGAVVGIAGNGGVINMYGGKIDASASTSSSWSPAISVIGQPTTPGIFNLYDGDVHGGTTSSAYANIMVGSSGSSYKGGATFNMFGGTVHDGINTTGMGGNFLVQYEGTLNVYGGVIRDGQNKRSLNYFGGGNIAVTGGAANIYGGIISGGKAVGLGGNIGVRNSSGYYGRVAIYGGKIIDGTANAGGDNIFVRGETAAETGGSLKIAGGQISSGIKVGDNTTFELSGAPVIKKSGIDDQTLDAAAAFAVTNGGNLDVSKITGGEIQIEGKLGDVFSAGCNNAKNIARYFVPVNPEWDVIANEDDKLQIVEYVAPVWGEFNPDRCGGMAYCEACGEAAGPKEWTALSGDAAKITAGGHYYLSDATTFADYGFAIDDTTAQTVCLNLNGQTLTAGNTAIALSNAAHTFNVMDPVGGGEVLGIVAGTSAAGAAISVNHADAEVNLYGGTFKRAAGSGTYSHAIQIGTAGGTVNVNEGAIVDGRLDGVTNAGAYPTAVYVRGGTFELNGGEIIGGTSSSNGGSVRVDTGAEFNLNDGSVSGGTARGGGNFYVNAGTLNVYDGSITGGTATHTGVVGGGNVLVHGGGKLHMEGGVISGGTAGSIGGNIAVRASNIGTVEIFGGKIYGGTAKDNANGHNIYVGAAASFLTISGGEIAGDIITGAGVTITLSGEPKIKTSGLTDAEGAAVTGNTGLNVTATSNISAAGVTGGEIQVTGERGVVFTKAGEDASAAAQYFDSTDVADDVAANAEGKLEIVEYVEPQPEEPPKDVFAPQDWKGRAWCPVCKSYESWTAVTNAKDTLNLTGHCYLSENIDKKLTIWSDAKNELCLNLNGYNITATDRSALGAATGIVNIMDTKGGSVVSGWGNGYAAGAAISVSNANTVLSIYGGTFTKAANATTCSVVVIGTNGGTIYMYDGATIDASGITNTEWASTVSVQGKAANSATFNMEGGVIKCGNMSTIATNYMGNINLGYAIQYGGAFFNLKGGIVYGGECARGGTFSVIMQNTLNISDGTIVNQNGAESLGGTIYTNGTGNTVAISGGTIVGDIYICGGTEFTVSKDAKVVKELTIGEETFTAKMGMSVEAAAHATVQELTANAEIYLSGAANTALVSVDGTVTAANLKAFNPKQIVDFVNDEAYLVLATVAIRSGEEERTYYKDAAAALAAYQAGSYLELQTADQTVTLNDEEVWIDANGYDLTVAGEGKVHAMDKSNDDYTRFQVWTVAEGAEIDFATDVINPINGRRYLVIRDTNDANKWSAHRIQMYLTGISLRPTAAGLYYKAAYRCDSTLADRVKTFGIVYRLSDGAKDDQIFGLIEEGNVASEATNFTENRNGTISSGTSAMIYGIFKNEVQRPATQTETTAQMNVKYGEYKIMATPYIVVDRNNDGTDMLEALANVNTANEAYKTKNGTLHAAMSLKDVLIEINKSNNDSNIAKAKDFYKTWKDLGMSDWAQDIAKISGYVPAV